MCSDPLPIKLTGVRCLLVGRESGHELQALSLSEQHGEHAGERRERNVGEVVVARSCSKANGLARPVKPPSENRVRRWNENRQTKGIHVHKRATKQKEGITKHGDVLFT